MLNANQVRFRPGDIKKSVLSNKKAINKGFLKSTDIEKCLREQPILYQQI